MWPTGECFNLRSFNDGQQSKWWWTSAKWFNDRLGRSAFKRRMAGEGPDSCPFGTPA
jgi:hypothetical protein